MASEQLPLKEEEKLPYWLMNVPEDKRPAKCPDFLLDISDRNKELIDRPEDEYHILTWPEVQNLISTYGRPTTPPEFRAVFRWERLTKG